jgi:hypothetical protein
MSPLCTEHGQVYGDGCKCPKCDEGKVIDVPIPEEGEHNLETSFLESEGKKRGRR